MEMAGLVIGNLGWVRLGIWHSLVLSQLFPFSLLRLFFQLISASTVVLLTFPLRVAVLRLAGTKELTISTGSRGICPFQTHYSRVMPSSKMYCFMESLLQVLNFMVYQGKDETLRTTLNKNLILTMSTGSSRPKLKYLGKMLSNKGLSVLTAFYIFWAHIRLFKSLRVHQHASAQP